MSNLRLFGTLTKVSENDDGTVEVHGIACSEKRDEDPKAIAKWGKGEVITADAIRKAIPDYLKHGGTGPLREMHQLSAAGRTLGIHVDDETNLTHIHARVVDSEAVKKVRTGVYVGFSVGGNATERDHRDPSIITGLNMTEISLVDRPANPDAVISLWKADAMAEPDSVAKGDSPGHPFRGNQWTSASSDAAAISGKAEKEAGKSPSRESRRAFKASEKAHGTSTKARTYSEHIHASNAHDRAAEAHENAAEAAADGGHEKLAQHHRVAAEAHDTARHEHIRAAFESVKTTKAAEPAEETTMPTETKPAGPVKPAATPEQPAKPAEPVAKAAEPAPAAAAAPAPAATPEPATPAEPPAAPVAKAAEPPAPAAPAQVDTVAKQGGIEAVWDAKSALEALLSILSLLYRESQEDHPEAAAQAAALKSAADSLRAFVASEIKEADAELTAKVAKSHPGSALLAAATARFDALLKAGARFSKLTKAAMNAHADALAKCRDDFLKLGWVDEAEDKTEKVAAPAAPPAEPPAADIIAKAARVDEVTKALTETTDALTKVRVERDEFEKTMGLAKDALAKVVGEREKLTAALKTANTRLEQKGVLRVVAVEKAADGGTPAEDEDTSTITDPVKRAEAEVRKVHRSGQVKKLV